MKKIVIPVLLALSLGVFGGCASTKDLEAVRTVADKAVADAAAARAAADKAAAAAAKAQSTADAAKSSADAAVSSADAAKSSAQSSDACCRDTQTKIDRLFKKSMYK
jgi:type IV secretory pathway TrbL component